MHFRHRVKRPCGPLAVLALLTAGTLWAASPNPVPLIFSAIPDIVEPGATTAVTLSGSNFVPGVVVLVDGVAAVTTFKSPTMLTAELVVAPTSKDFLQLQVRNPGLGGGVSRPVSAAIASPVSFATAARILEQTTFGPTRQMIAHVQQEGIAAWLQEQYDTPQTLLPLLPPFPFPHSCESAAYCAESAWWKVAMTGKDQFRQRVAFALSQLLVISDTKSSYRDIAPYANVLAKDAFGSWRTTMQDITLQPGMGIYLDMLNSSKPPAGQIANENFARENLQLFNVGLVLLNQDGSVQTDGSGSPIPAYTEEDVKAFARAFTGWTWANQDGSIPAHLNPVSSIHGVPMVPVESEHDEDAKALLNGVILPSGQTAEEDLAGALDNIFAHPNVAPFVSRALIQHLVAGDPSPAYVARVAAVFADDGLRVRGDMKAVLNAILLDPEARAGDVAGPAESGHLREPVLWLTSVLRGLGSVNPDPSGTYVALSKAMEPLNEEPYASPSVFNFFPPSYVIPGTDLNEPEFGVENTGSIGLLRTLADNLVNNKISHRSVYGGTYTSSFVDLSATSFLGQLADRPAVMVTTLGQMFVHGRMNPDTFQAIVSEVSAISDRAQRVRVATYLVITSAQFKVLH